MRVDHLANRLVVALQLPSGRDMLHLPGIVVSGHVGRNVSRVEVDGEPAYLKIEHRVRFRDRWRSWLAGFGHSSLALREYQIIRRLREHGLPAPQLLARGEVDRQAFLLLAPVDGAIELRQMEHVAPTLAARLGQIVAGIHSVGVDQPDLFAKHFLLNPKTGDLTILDWQRARLCKIVSRRDRVRSIAALRATSPDSVWTPDAWLAFIKAYAAATSESVNELAQAIDDLVRSLRQKPSIRSQLVAKVADQKLVRIDGETVCAIPDLAEELGCSEVRRTLYDPARSGQRYPLRDERIGMLRVSRYPFPVARYAAILRGKTWRSPELKVARLLFHLERHGIPAPKLLAYGQRTQPSTGAFVLYEPLDCRPATANHANAIRDLLDRLHAAGSQLRRTGQPFGMIGSTAVIHDINHVRLNRRLSKGQMARDHLWLDRMLGGRR